MEISEFLVRVIILFFPGIVGKIVLDQLITTEEKRSFYFSVYAFLLGLTSYIILEAIAESLYHFWSVTYDVSFFKLLFNDNMSVDYSEIAHASGIAVLLGFGLAYMINFKILNRFAQLIKATNRFAEVGVWEYVHDLDEPSEWVVLRDQKYNLVYRGWVSAYSDKIDDCEILIRDVEVFDDESNPLFCTPSVYLSRYRNEITLEFPKLDYEELDPKEWVNKYGT